MTSTPKTPQGFSWPVRQRIEQGFLYVLSAIIVLVIVVGLYRGGVEISQLEADQVTLSELPYALMLSFLRMLGSYVFSLVFAFCLGIVAAVSKWGERLIIPMLDILQSVPVVGFFPAAITFFIGITNGHRLGVELAACFLIFTSQAWNLAFAIYEAIKGIPQSEIDAVANFGVKGIHKFWKLYAPASVPRLVYNSILSWSNGWFFLVACEIIAVGPARYHLPGIGSFLSRAAEQNHMNYVLWGLFALTLLILTIDYLFWRPASIWSNRFKHEQTLIEDLESVPFESMPKTVLSPFRPIARAVTQLFGFLIFPVKWLLHFAILKPLTFFYFYVLKILRQLVQVSEYPLNQTRRLLITLGISKDQLIWIFLIGSAFFLTGLLVDFLKPPWPPLFKEIPQAILLSTFRLFTALSLSLLWILPLVLFTWNRPRIRRALTTLAQVGASLPAIALFPLFIVVAVETLGGGMEVASILMLMTGMQWYVLFNCLGGTATIPSDLQEAARAFGLKGPAVWRRLVLPAIRPSLVTGSLTAWGGGWNALVVAEYVSFREKTLTVNGIGSLLNHAVYELGDSRAIALCLIAMVSWILLINLLIWRPIYRASIERYKFD